MIYNNNSDNNNNNNNKKVNKCVQYYTKLGEFIAQLLVQKYNLHSVFEVFPVLFLIFPLIISLLAGCVYGGGGLSRRTPTVPPG